jgi:hypothetical protein
MYKINSDVLCRYGYNFFLTFLSMSRYSYVLLLITVSVKYISISADSISHRTANGWTTDQYTAQNTAVGLHNTD